MTWIIGTSLRFRLLVVAIAAGILLFGGIQLRKASVDVLPEIAPPSVEIQTEALGLSAQEVEQLITVPLEQDLLNGVPWLAGIHSESMPGLSSVVMTFDPGTDPLRARQVVGERLTQAFALPHVSKPPTMLQPMSASSRVMMVGVSANTQDLNLIDLSVLARWTIAPRLMGVPGVAAVSIWGQRDRQLQVQVDPKNLQARNVTLLQVLETTGNAMWVSSLSFLEASTPGTGGFIDTANQRLGIRHVFPISSPEGLAQVPLEGSASLRLGDVADVVEDHQLLIGDALTDGSSLLLVVEKSPGANTLELTENLDKAIAAMEPGLPGVKIDASVYRPANFIDMVIANLTKALIAGGVLILMVLGVFFFNWRAALISAITIPVSLTAGAIVLYLRDATINAMVFAGFLVALGLVIDDAIVNVDHTIRRLHEQKAGATPASVMDVVLQSTLEVRSALLYATLIVALAIVPAWFVAGLTGALLQPLVTSFGLAVLASMLVGLILTPALSALVLARAPAARGEGPLVRWVGNVYGRLLAPVLRAPRFALAALTAVAVVAIATLPFMRPSLVPAFKEPDLLIHVDGMPGTSQTEMDRIVARMSSELRTVSGVRNVGAHVGRALLSDRVVDVNSSDIWVSIDPSAPYDATVATVRGVVKGYPGLRESVQTYLQDRSAAVADKSDALAVRVFGEDPATLRSVANDVQKGLSGINGIVGEHLEAPPQQPTLDVEVDLPAAQRYGLTPGDVRRAAAAVISGISVGSLFEEQKIFDVIVWGTPETRMSVTNIEDMLLDTPTGGHVRLGDVAKVSVVPALSVIRHEDVRSYIDIRLDVSGRSTAAVASDIQQRIAGMQFPLEYHAEVQGNYAVQDAAQTRLIALAIAMVLGMLLVFQAAFGTWRLAALSVVLVPSTAVGGLLVVLASGGDLSLGALVGLLAVIGIAARNLVMLVRTYQQIERDDGLPFGPQLIMRGARLRVGPLVATALATVLAMLPFVFAGNVAGLEIARPLAIVVVCGLLTSTLINLFVSPAAYLLLGAVRAEALVPAVAPPAPIAAGHAAD
jgi:CzcA family heavy metal efflux pump